MLLVTNHALMKRKNNSSLLDLSPTTDRFPPPLTIILFCFESVILAFPRC